MPEPTKHKPKINQADYLLVQTQLLMLADLTANLDLVGFLAAIDRAETVGPVMDPTLWKLGSHNLQSIKQLAEKLRAFQVEVQRQRAAAGAARDGG